MTRCVFCLGLVSKVFPPDQLVDKAVELAEQIAAHSPIIVQMAKEAVNTCKWYIAVLDKLDYSICKYIVYYKVPTSCF